MNLRKIAGFACALTLAAPLGFVLGTPSATAATAVQTCGSLKGTVALSPGLSTTPKSQTVTAKGNAAKCTPSKATGGAGTLAATTHIANGSCQALASGTTLPLKGSIKWKNGKTSSVTMNAKTTSKAPTTANITGKVSAGLFAGKTITGQIKFTIVNTGSGSPCTPTNPVKKLTFTNSKPFVI
ncbi:MAG TPA: hypothetical protein VGI86_10550 [Acidimicrobiia bacterium]|jgi:hypothetical protein